MHSGMGKLGRMGRGRFYLALTYFLWSLLPHFHVLTHSHAAGSHSHASLSAAQVDLANRVLENLGPAELPDAEAAEVGGGLTAGDVRPPGGSHAALAPVRSGSELHGHFWEDPNLAGLVSRDHALPFCAALIALAFASYASPSLRILHRAAARGPPALLPA